MYIGGMVTNPDTADTADTALGAELLRVIARFNRWATRHGEWAIPAAQARLLAQVDELGPARIGALARADHCSQPAMTTQVRRLESAGLLTRIPDPADGRAVLVSLTSSGRRALDEIRAARASALAPVIDRLDARERERVRAALHTLTDLLAAASAGADEPAPREND